MAIETQKYLDYLDKEMTIMGILSGLSVAAPAGILNAVLGEKNSDTIGGELWRHSRFCIVIGSVLCIVAAGFFYKQRSRLAYFYGQICLADIFPDDPPGGQRSDVLLREADYWAAWWPYSWAFIALTAGFVEYLMGFVSLLAHSSYENRATGFNWWVLAICAPPVLAIIAAYIHWRVYTIFASSDHPWQDTRNNMGVLFGRARSSKS